MGLKAHAGGPSFSWSPGSACSSRSAEVVDVDKEDTVFVAAHVRARGKGSGVDVEMDIYDVLSFRNGLLVLRRTWPDRAPAIAALGRNDSSVE